MNWWQPLLLTLQLMVGSVLISGLVGLVGAWGATVATSSLGVAFKRGGRGNGLLAVASRFAGHLFFLAMVAAIATPMVLHAAAWEAAAGKFGWLSLTQSGSRTYEGLAGRYSGMVACVWVHGLLGAAMVSLATWVGMRRIPSVFLRQASLEMGPWRRWWTVQLPLAAPWTITALLATAAFAATEMTVADLYGVRTLADSFYLFHAANPDVGSVLSTLVLPAVFALTIIAHWFLGKHRSFDLQDRVAGPSSEAFAELSDADQGDATRMDIGEDSAASQAMAIVALFVCASLITLIPIASLVIKAGHDVTLITAADGSTVAKVTWSATECISRLLRAPLDFAKEYQWTIVIGLGAACLATMVAWPLAMFGRGRPVFRRVVDVSAVAAFLIPGPIVGLMIVKCFAMGLPGMRAIYQQTLLPTWIALSVRGVPIAYWILRTGYQGIGRDVVHAGRLDLTWAKRIWSIDRPLLAGSLLASMLAVAVFATGDVPATLPVIPPGVTSVGTRLFALLHSGARYQEASLAIWYLICILFFAGWAKRRWMR
ncbi:ABC transporter permease [Stieleria varia]|uniref:ABC transmembrane type-1 domain-containing protein n=1 Tax=Stieleria varia TaxID=2528005 RepID=A0A5C6B543_9BACT|nr:hypothetical protein [Stieleria varia]TWU05584.1 hypothetical protein Pla52n_12990 [Stieleria varia]